MIGILLFVLLVTNVLGDCITCNKCIANNSPKINGRYVIYPSTYNTCNIGPLHTHFDIKPQKGFNGCGYQKDINTVYAKCSKQCIECHKSDNKCSSFADKPSSTIRCPLKPCIRRGNSIQHATECCPGLEVLDFKCINPKLDCTPCGSKIELNKPCCSTSGIKNNGYWKCASGKCVDSRDCGGNECCISGTCLPKGKDKDTGQNNSC